MTNKNTIAVIFIIVSLSLSGCQLYTQSDDGPVLRYDGSLDIENGTFTMNGELIQTGRQPETPDIDDLTVYLYAKNKTLLGTYSMGSFANARVSIQTEYTPEYVIIYSTDFENYNHIEFEYYRLSNSQTVDYNVYTVGSRDELPTVPGSE